MTFFALGIEKAVIHSNREWFAAECRFHSFVRDEQLSLPGAEKLQDASSVDERRKIVREMIPATISKWETITIENIPDRHTFRFGDTGRILYRANFIPQTLDWNMLLIEGDQDIRELGKRLDNFFTNERLDTISAAIRKMAGVTKTPALAAGAVLAKQIAQGVSFLMKNNENDQLGVIEQSFIRELHYPQGSRQREAVADVTGNMYYDYFIYGVDKREDERSAANNMQDGA